VSFKRNHRSFLLNSWTPCAVHLGDYVKVEADRGEDLGVVVGKTQYLDHHAAGPPEKVTDRRSSGHGRSSAHNKRGAAAAAAPSSHEIKRIIRHATEEEKIEMMDKAAEEDAVLKVCRTKVRHRTLQMRVIDAEYVLLLAAALCAAAAATMLTPIRFSQVPVRPPQADVLLRGRAPDRLPRARPGPVRGVQDAHLAAADRGVVRVRVVRGIPFQERGGAVLVVVVS